MKVIVKNCPDKNFKPYVERALSFYSKELIPNTRVRNNCETTIRFTSKIKDFGYAIVKSSNSRKQPRKFLIEVHPGIGARNILETLAHEMVHIKQYINGETDDQLTVWRGQSIDSNTVEYWSHPWEIDAYGREVGLFTKFAMKEKLWDVFENIKNPDLPIVSIPIKWKK